MANISVKSMDLLLTWMENYVVLTCIKVGSVPPSFQKSNTEVVVRLWLHLSPLWLNDEHNPTYLVRFYKGSSLIMKLFGILPFEYVKHVVILTMTLAWCIWKVSLCGTHI